MEVMGVGLNFLVQRMCISGCAVTVCHRENGERKRERETGRETERQTDTDRETERVGEGIYV